MLMVLSYLLKKSLQNENESQLNPKQAPISSPLLRKGLLKTTKILRAGADRLTAPAAGAVSRALGGRAGQSLNFIQFFFSLGKWQNDSRFYLVYAYLVYRGAKSALNNTFLRYYVSTLLDLFTKSIKGPNKDVPGLKSANLELYQTLNDYFFLSSSYLLINKNSRWYSMEEIINHFLFYSEGPSLPAGFSQGSVEAPKGHLAVSIISQGGNKPVRSRIRSSILVMAGHLNNLVQNVGLGDFVVIVSASNIVVGEIDR